MPSKKWLAEFCVRERQAHTLSFPGFINKTFLSMVSKNTSILSRSPDDVQDATTPTTNLVSPPIWFMMVALFASCTQCPVSHQPLQQHLLHRAAADYMCSIINSIISPATGPILAHCVGLFVFLLCDLVCVWYQQLAIFTLPFATFYSLQHQSSW